MSAKKTKAEARVRAAVSPVLEKMKHIIALKEKSPPAKKEQKSAAFAKDVSVELIGGDKIKLQTNQSAASAKKEEGRAAEMKPQMVTWALRWSKIKEKLAKKPLVAQPKQKVQTRPPRRRKKQVTETLLKAGYDDPLVIERGVFRFTVAITFLVSLWALFLLSTLHGITWQKVALWIGTLWTFGFLGIMFLAWMLFYIYVDYRILKRRQEIEEILPDFLQLTSANIKAGMTVDRALWYAVRPNFGVLAREIEIVAKETMGGEELRSALKRFSDKYDSQVLTRSIALINEGIESGGEIGDLLIKVASNIEDQKIMVKEMSANVTTYVIFITFSSIIAAPFLFALSGVLIDVLHQISGSLAESGGTSGANVGFNFSGSGVTASDFRIFAIVELTISAIFSAVVLSTIKKGNIREGTKNIPVFVAVAITLYLFASSIAGKFMGFFF